MRLIARFSKSADLKYISHLDLLRLFQRALRRAAIPVAYSEGYSPHMLFSFACALPVGVASDAEYIDIELEKDIEPKDFMQRVNAVLPEGVIVMGVKEWKKDFPSLTSVVALSVYDYTLPADFDSTGLEERLTAFMAQGDISIDKKSKSGVKLVNIRPMIHKLSVMEGTIRAKLTAGNQYNLRGDVFGKVLADYLQIRQPANIKRIALYVLFEGKVYEPIAREDGE